MNGKQTSKAAFHLSEDWWAVIVAFVLIVLSAVLAKLGWLGENGLQIKF